MPPITPANAIAPELSAMTKSFLDNLIFVSLSKCIGSSGLANLITTSPCNLS
jgi:hypothetical protein